MSRKLNVFDVLKHINQKDRAYYDTLSEEQQREFSHVVLFLWLSSSTDARQLVIMNEFLNTYLMDLHTHPHLLYMLMVVSSSGINQRYEWLQTSKPYRNVKLLKVVSEFHGISQTEAEDVLQMFDKNSIENMANSLGYQSDEIDELKKELI